VTGPSFEPRVVEHDSLATDRRAGAVAHVADLQPVELDVFRVCDRRERLDPVAGDRVVVVANDRERAFDLAEHREP
jgi:hypothetical protein